MLISLMALFMIQDSTGRYADQCMAEWNKVRNQVLADNASGDLDKTYFTSYEGDGLCAAAEATGREDIIQACIEYADALIRGGKDADNDGYIDFYDGTYKKWVTDVNVRDTGHTSIVFKGLRPLPRVARVIMQKFRREPYLTKAREYTEFVRKHIVEKAEKQTEFRTYNAGTIHLRCHTAEIVTELYLLTGNAAYRAHAEKFAQAVKDQMVLVDGAYVWTMKLGQKDLKQYASMISDTSHANGTTAFVALAWRAGIVFTNQDMDRFVQTFRTKVYRGASVPFYNLVDGTGTSPGYTFSSDGWSKMGFYNLDVTKLLHGYYRKSRAVQYYGNMALAQAIRGTAQVRLAPLIGNQAPTVNAGVDQTITLPSSASLSGTASDDGLPNPPARVTVTWSKVSGPGTVTFSAAGALKTSASFSQSGTYVLKLRGSDGSLSAEDQVAITVRAESSLPVPMPVSPAGGSYVNTNTVRFTCTDLGSSIEAYQFLIQHNPSGTWTEYSTLDSAGPAVSTNLPLGRRYRWMCRAGADGSFSPWSPAAAFESIDGPLEAPRQPPTGLQAVANNDGTVTLTWSAAQGATSYLVEVEQVTMVKRNRGWFEQVIASIFGGKGYTLRPRITPAGNAEVGQASHTLTLGAGAYRFHVAAKNRWGASGFSEYADFSK